MVSIFATSEPFFSISIAFAEIEGGRKEVPA
jgi:hypothetical protein